MLGMKLGVLEVEFTVYSISKFYFLLKDVNFIGHLATLFRFRIDAITLYGVPAVGPHGFHAIGRLVDI